MINFKGKHSWSFLVICTFVVLFIFSVNIHTCSSLEDEWWPTPYCNETSDNYYTNGSKFVSNVKISLNSLRVDVEDTSQKRFNTSVYGQNPNQIYALLQCRGDATAEECYNCSQAAKVAVVQCQNRVGSRVYKKFCFLRYNGNYNFIGKLDPGIYDNWTNNATSSDPAAYVAAAQKLLSDLSSDITSGAAKNRYASGLTVDSAQFHEIYGMAQCWGDISLTDCKTCLSTKIDQLFKYNTGRLGARGLAGSCVVQYEAKPFFNPSPPPPPQPPHNPPSLASPPPAEEKSSNTAPLPPPY